MATNNPPRIVLLCATQRGLAVLKTLTQLTPGCELVVFSFREKPWEPPFFDAIRDYTLARKGLFFDELQVETQALETFWEQTPIDLLVAVSWRYMIPARAYQKARLGAYVFHDSLLPAYRGFSPTVWAMINGEDHTGVSLFAMDEGMDSGDLVAQQRIRIDAHETIAPVLERVTVAYLELLSQTLPALLAGTAARRPQDHSLATYTCRRVISDNQIDWQASTSTVFNLIRAVTKPYPGAYTWLGDKKLTIWQSARPPVSRNFVGRRPGRVVEVHPGLGAVVLTGDGTILIREVQLEDGPVRCAAEVLNGGSPILGHRLQ